MFKKMAARYYGMGLRSLVKYGAGLWSLLAVSHAHALIDFSGFETGFQTELVQVPGILVNIALSILPVVLTVYVIGKAFSMARR